MKILFVIPALGSVYGGPSQCVLDLAQALGRQADAEGRLLRLAASRTTSSGRPASSSKKFCGEFWTRT